MCQPRLLRNEEDAAFASDSSAVPSKGVELTCLGLGQSASSGHWPSPSPLEMFDDARESVCELLGDVAGRKLEQIDNYLIYSLFQFDMMIPQLCIHKIQTAAPVSVACAILATPAS